MVDLLGQDKGNISLSMKLQSWDEDKDKSKPTIYNTQKAFYSIRIEDIQNRINRLEQRNTELLEEIEATDERLITLDEKTADEIASISKQFHTQDDKVEGLKTRIENVENTRLEDKQNYDNQVELHKQKYKEKKTELVSQIKVLSAKINAMDDFKKTQTGLKEKFERNEERMKQNKKKIEELLKIVRQKFEFDKEMLKNEMYICLLGLAAQFQVETDKGISLPNKRLLRENLVLKSELELISKRVSLENSIQPVLKNSIVDYKKKIVENSLSSRRNIVVSKIQNAILKCLKRKFENVKKHFSVINIPDPKMEGKYSKLIEDAFKRDQEMTIRIAKLTNILQKEKLRINVAKYLNRKLNCKIRAAIETIYDLKYIMKRLIKCPDNYSEIANLNCIEQLALLRNILDKGQLKISCGFIKSVETITQYPDFTMKDLEGISIKDEDFEIATESEDKDQVLDKIKSLTYLDQRKVIQIESIESMEEAIEEQSVKELVEDIGSFDLKDDHKSSHDDDDDDDVVDIREDDDVGEDSVGDESLGSIEEENA